MNNRCLLCFAATVVVVFGCATPTGSSHGQSTRGGEHPGPAVFQIGNAVSPINYWMTAWMLADVFKTAGFEAEIGDTRPSEMWIPVVGGRWAMERRWDVDTDEMGWAKSLRLDRGGTAERLSTIVMANDDPNAYPAGIYRVLFEGAGEMQFDGAEVVARPNDGEIHIDYDGSGHIILSIVQTDPAGTGDYIRNIRMLRPDAEEGQQFIGSYLDYLRPFAVIRPLHFLGDQLAYGPAIPWGARKPEGYSHWGGALGAPYEVAIALANQSESDLWLNVPIAAGDEFVAELARLVHDRLDAERKLYVELGNELWNWADPYSFGRDIALRQARTRWPGVEGTVQPWSKGEEVNELMMLYSRQGARTVEVGEVFRREFGSAADRVFVVLAGQIGASVPNWAPSRYLLETPVHVGVDGGRPAGREVDAFAVAPYIGGAAGEIEFSRDSAAAFIDDAIAYVRGEGRWNETAPEPGLRYLIKSDVALAREFDLPLVAYEGGQHFVGSRFTRDEVNVHPRMYDLYRALFDVWREEGGGLFVHFAGIIPRGRNEPGTEPGYYESENFGIKERQTQTREEAPKWAAVLDVIDEIGRR